MKTKKNDPSSAKEKMDSSQNEEKKSTETQPVPEVRITPRKKADRTEKYWELMNTVLDPDIGYGIVDLGLIYDLKVDDEGIATVYMTLTSPMCPSGDYLLEEVEKVLVDYPGFKEAYVEIIWEPVWEKEMIDEDIRYMLFGE